MSAGATRLRIEPVSAPNNAMSAPRSGTATAARYTTSTTDSLNAARFRVMGALVARAGGAAGGSPTASFVSSLDDPLRTSFVADDSSAGDADRGGVVAAPPPVVGARWPFVGGAAPASTSSSSDTSSSASDGSSACNGFAVSSASRKAAGASSSMPSSSSSTRPYVSVLTSRLRWRKRKAASSNSIDGNSWMGNVKITAITVHTLATMGPAASHAESCCWPAISAVMDPDLTRGHAA
mmetsp:Transcript_36585/g.112104  ORF Transcript_36585/g.112104 Transcript_36585/m.112104 type:complete len:237 (-) Transcript_36585:971-1681(-)